MRRFRILMLPLLFVGLIGCQVDETDTTTTRTGTTAAETDVQALTNDIDDRLRQIDSEVESLQNRLAGMDAEVREDVQGTLEEARDEREDLAELRTRAAGATTIEEIENIRLEMWEEYRDVQNLLTEARLEAAREANEYQQTVNTELSTYDRTIQELEADAANVSAEMREEYDEQAEAMRSERDAIRRNLDEMGEDAESRWEEMRNDLVEEWREFRRTVGRAVDPDRTVGDDT